MTALSDTQMLIGSAFVAGTETPETVLNPKTEETLLDLPEASVDQIDAAVNAADKAFRTGRAPRRPNAPRCCSSLPIALKRKRNPSPRWRR